MSRGEASPLGFEKVSQNGYTYVKTPENKWRLKHHLIAEKNLGRSIDTKIERVIFKDHDRKNFDPDNIVVEPKKGVTKETKRARLLSRIEELEGQLAELDEEVAS
jgi:hypothetical protein